MPHLVTNERTKLTATWLNGLSVAIFAVGGFAPLVSSIYADAGPSLAVLLVSLVCFIACGALHFVARHMLRGLRE